MGPCLTPALQFAVCIQVVPHKICGSNKCLYSSPSSTTSSPHINCYLPKIIYYFWCSKHLLAELTDCGKCCSTSGLLLLVHCNTWGECVTLNANTGSADTCATKLACTCYKKHQQFFPSGQPPPNVKFTTRFLPSYNSFTRGACQSGYWADPETRQNWVRWRAIGGNEWKACALSDYVRQACNLARVGEACPE
ncbi:unnamed protein product [Cercospora beticola]|nr:unnamed protein product [Cercospora beticola]